MIRRSLLPSVLTVAALGVAGPARADQVIDGTYIRVYYDTDGYWNDGGVDRGWQGSHGE
jgi:hypothetical protein